MTLKRSPDMTFCRGSRLALTLTGQNDVRAVSYGTEAGLFEGAGCPAVVCGPGDVAQAHTADEFIEADQLDRFMALLDRVGAHACKN